MKKLIIIPQSLFGGDFNALTNLLKNHGDEYEPIMLSGMKRIAELAGVKGNYEYLEAVLCEKNPDGKPAYKVTTAAWCDLNEYLSFHEDDDSPAAIYISPTVCTEMIASICKCYTRYRGRIYLTDPKTLSHVNINDIQSKPRSDNDPPKIEKSDGFSFYLADGSFYSQEFSIDDRDVTVEADSIFIRCRLSRDYTVKLWRYEKSDAEIQKLSEMIALNNKIGFADVSLPLAFVNPVYNDKGGDGNKKIGIVIKSDDNPTTVRRSGMINVSISKKLEAVSELIKKFIRLEARGFVHRRLRSSVVLFPDANRKALVLNTDEAQYRGYPPSSTPVEPDLLPHKFSAFANGCNPIAYSYAAISWLEMCFTEQQKPLISVSASQSFFELSQIKDIFSRSAATAECYSIITNACTNERPISLLRLLEKTEKIISELSVVDFGATTLEISEIKTDPELFISKKPFYEEENTDEVEHTYLGRNTDVKIFNKEKEKSPEIFPDDLEEMKTVNTDKKPNVNTRRPRPRFRLIPAKLRPFLMHTLSPDIVFDDENVIPAWNSFIETATWKRPLLLSAISILVIIAELIALSIL